MYIYTDTAAGRVRCRWCVCVLCLHAEYAERRLKYRILFIFSLFCEYINLEYVRVPVIFRVNQAEYVIHFLVAASKAYVKTYSTRRVLGGEHPHRHDPPRVTTTGGRLLRVSNMYIYVYPLGVAMMWYTTRGNEKVSIAIPVG